MKILLFYNFTMINVNQIADFLFNPYVDKNLSSLFILRISIN